MLLKNTDVRLLLLLLGLSLSLFSGSLLSDTPVLLLVLGESQGSVGGLLWHLNSLGGGLGGGLDNREGNGGVDLLTLSLGLLVEDDQLGLVLVQAGDVSVEVLLRLVLSSVVNGNAHSSGVLGGQTGGLDLSQSETTAGSHLSVVLDSRTSDNRSQGIHWGWGNLGGLLQTVLSSGFLLAGLVKVDSDTFLPVLSEVVLQQGLVL